MLDLIITSPGCSLIRARAMPSGSDLSGRVLVVSNGLLTRGSRIEVGDDSGSCGVLGENKVLKNFGEGRKDETGRVGF